MGFTKQKLRKGLPVYGGWVMIAHPTMIEIYSGERFDWVSLDMEHTSIDLRSVHECILAAKGTDIDVLVRLPSHEASIAKRVLDAGAAGVIVPCVNSAQQARQVVEMTKYPPEGNRGASLSRSTDFGRNFYEHFEHDNDNVIVVIMLEHVDVLNHLDDILRVPGIDAALIGPYDLSASMGLAGQLTHPKVVAAQHKILESCLKYGIPAGYHVTQPDVEMVRQRVEEGFRFIGCSLDTEFILQGCRQIVPLNSETISLDSVKQKVVG
jgi:2-dehydro-3-deoxyglucarate aldolase